MSQSGIQQRSSDSTQELGDESFMSATELSNYVMQTELAKASKYAGSDTAEKAREVLIRSLKEPVAVTPEKIAEVERRVLSQLRSAAVKGHYGLKAMIVDWSAGLPGDIGFFLTWDDAKR